MPSSVLLLKRVLTLVDAAAGGTLLTAKGQALDGVTARAILELPGELFPSPLPPTLAGWTTRPS